MSKTEREILTMSRRAAKVIIQLRAKGDHYSVAQIRMEVIEQAERMRAEARAAR